MLTTIGCENSEMYEYFSLQVFAKNVRLKSQCKLKTFQFHQNKAYAEHFIRLLVRSFQRLLFSLFLYYLL